MNREEARAILHLTALQGEDAASVKSAFNLAMLGAHPDTSPVGSAEKVQRVKAARDYLLRSNFVGENACQVCRGSGYVQGIRCVACATKGEVRQWR